MKTDPDRSRQIETDADTAAEIQDRCGQTQAARSQTQAARRHTQAARSQGLKPSAALRSPNSLPPSDSPQEPVKIFRYKELRERDLL